MKFIICDTRQQAGKHDKKHAQIAGCGVHIMTCCMPCGDYCSFDKGGEGIIFDGYDADDDPRTIELIVKAPYDDIYIYWLEAQIDYFNGETAKYNNSIATFNSAYSDFSAAYNREHMPKPHTTKYF